MTSASDVAFTPAVKAIQQQRGSRAAYARMEAKGGWRTTVTPELADFIAGLNSFFLATANAAGHPYIQHRGGPPGFLKIVDEQTLGFTDYTGNRQYITTGNLSENPRAFMFLIDYVQRRRIKVWGTARVVAEDRVLIRRLLPENYEAKPEQAILFTIEAWDVNCPQHIPQMLPVAEVAAAFQGLQARIAQLEADNAALRDQLSQQQASQ